MQTQVRNKQRHHNRPSPARTEQHRHIRFGTPQLPAHQHHRVHQHQRRRRSQRKIQRQHPTQLWEAQHRHHAFPHTTRHTFPLIDAQTPRACNHRRRPHKTHRRNGKYLATGRKRQQHRGQHGTQNLFKIISNTRQRQGRGVLILVVDDARNQRLERGSKRRGSHLQNRHRHVHLRLRGDKRQTTPHRYANDITAHQHSLHREASKKGRQPRTRAYINQNLDRERHRHHCARAVARYIEGEEPKTNV